MELKGKIIEVLPLAQGVSKTTGNAWKSQDFVIEYATDVEGRYTKQTCIKLFGAMHDKFAHLLSVGAEVIVKFDVTAQRARRIIVGTMR